MNLSLILVVRNEEKQLSELLPLYKDMFAEILVVDQASDDNTKDVVIANRCRYEKTYNWGFSEPSKNYAAFLAKHEWCVSLDADERLTESALTQLEVLDTINYDCYYLERFNIGEKKVRVFRRGYVHCQPILHRDYNPRHDARIGYFSGNAIVHVKDKTEQDSDNTRYNDLFEKYKDTPIVHQMNIIREKYASHQEKRKP